MDVVMQFITVLLVIFFMVFYFSFIRHYTCDWPGDLLSSRLIGVMLLTIAAGCAYGWRARSTARLMLMMSAVYGLGLSLASLWNTLANKPPIKVSYLIVFAIVFWVSLIMLLMDTTPQTAPSPEHTPS